MNKMMKIVFLSDTHGKHNEVRSLAQADILIHGGDVSWAGTSKEVVEFIEWFGALDYRYKVFIGGNHDSCLDGKEKEIIQSFLPDNCFYLCNSGVEIEGVKIWGIPFFFSNDIEGNYGQLVEQVPVDTDILITHCPPLGVLDKSTWGANMGNEELCKRVKVIKPQYHLFGHIHEGHGICENDNIVFINGSVLDENYDLLNTPIVFDV